MWPRRGKPLTRQPHCAQTQDCNSNINLLVEGRCSSHRKVGLSGSMGFLNMKQRRPFINLNGEHYVY